MTPYYLVLIGSVIIAKFSSLGRYLPTRSSGGDNRDLKSPNRTNIWLDGLLILFLTGFAAFRYNVGTDFWTYARLYSGIDAGNWRSTVQDSAQEVGYTLFSIASKTAFDSEFAIFWTTSFVTILFAVLRLRKIDGSFALSIFLYISLTYYLAPFNIVRQGIALSIVFWAEQYYRTNKFKFAVWMLIASCFHVSVIFFVIGYVCSRRLVPSFQTLIAAVGIASAGVLFLRFVPGVGSALALLNDRYDDYLQAEGAGFGTYLTIAFRVLIIVYLLVLFKRRESVNGHLIVLVILSLAFLIMGLENKLIARAEIYFSIFLIPAVVEAMRGQENKIIHYYCIVLAGFAYMTAYISYYAGLVPYDTQFAFYR